MMRLTSAGHPLPVLVRPGLAPATVGPPGLLLGMTTNARWQERVIELMPGDALLFYTDGVTDTPSGSDRFGEERLLAALAEPSDPATMIASVQRALRAFQIGDVVDDRAMLALQLVAVSGAGVSSSTIPQPNASVI
jgi:serine phosphatase RsbU (regulator of sigma subunit)